MFNDMELWNRDWLAGTRFFIPTGEPTDDVTIKYFTKHIIYVFYRSHICLFYL